MDTTYIIFCYIFHESDIHGTHYVLKVNKVNNNVTQGEEGK